MDFEKIIQDQARQIKQVTLVLDEALKMLDSQSSTIEEQMKRIKELETIILKTQGKFIKKDSSNSNLPPSNDINKPKRNNSLRKKSTRKTGGQPGHKAHFLELKVDPDEVISIIPEACLACGKLLDSRKKVLAVSKQEIDIPPIHSIVTQYDSYEIECKCGACCVGEFPERLKAKVQYGPRIRAFINYMSIYQFVPYQRLQLFCKTIFNLPLSQGTIFNTIQRSAKNSGQAYNAIKAFLSTSKVVGADETSVKVNGKKHYNWVWQNGQATFIACEDSRRKENIYKHFPDGFPNATLVSDRYRAHLSTPAKNYQICWVHLLRLLNYLFEAEDNPWLHKVKRIYKRAKKLEEQKTVWQRDEKRVRRLENDFNKLLLTAPNKKDFPESFKLHKGLIVNRHALFTFLYLEGVPSHNNASERAIRNSKVKTKISGQFKSAQNYFAILRSIIDTLIKNNKSVFDSLFNLEVNGTLNLKFLT